MSRQCDPVGVVEVAARLGVTRKAVDKWRERGQGFPPPRWLVGGRPSWNWDDITTWAASTGREVPPVATEARRGAAADVTPNFKK